MEVERAPAPEPAAPSTRARRRERRRKLTQDAWNLPNILTYARVGMIPAVLWLLDRGTRRDGVWAAMLYSLAAITDLLDGWLARRLNVVSVIGKVLDPLADKLMVMACLVWMVEIGRIPAWAVILLLSRELSITGLRAIASNEGVVIAAEETGKQKTALQMVGILCMIIGYPYELHILGIDLGIVDLVLVGRALVYASLILSFASAAQYVALFASAVEAKEAREDADERPSREGET
ncbi:MAG: CDP-diacylglycerol--glycerol-3-phosphate 3-phosphatidyltransferase [Polyangiales bacterium]